MKYVLYGACKDFDGLLVRKDKPWVMRIEKFHSLQLVDLPKPELLNPTGTHDLRKAQGSEQVWFLKPAKQMVTGSMQIQGKVADRNIECMIIHCGGRQNK